MNEFVLWGLGTIVGFFGGMLMLILFDIYTERKEKQKEHESKTETNAPK